MRATQFGWRRKCVSMVRSRFAAAGAVAAALYVQAICGGWVPASAASRPLARIRLERDIRVRALRILRPVASNRLFAIHDGAVGVLSPLTLGMTDTCGTTWTKILGRHRRRASARATAFAAEPSFSPDGSRFVALAFSGTGGSRPMGAGLKARWQIWSFGKKKPLSTLHTGTLGPLPIPPRGPQRLLYVDGGRKLVGFGGGAIYFFSAKTSQLLFSPAPLISYHIVRLQSEPKGPLLAAYCTMPRRIEVWNSRSGKRVVVIAPPAGTRWGPATCYAIGGGRVAVAWGRHLALYSAVDGRCLAEAGFPSQCYAPAFTISGSALAVCTADAPMVRNGTAGERNRATLRVWIFRVERKLVAAGRSVPFRCGTSGYRQLTWWGKHTLIFCSSRRALRWQVSWKLRR